MSKYPMLHPDGKVCEYPECGSVLILRYPSEVNKKRFCSQQCRYGWQRKYIVNKYPMTHPDGKVCENPACGKPLIVRNASDIGRKRFCSRVCLGALQTQYIVNRTKHYPIPHPDGRRCANPACGEVLVVRHATEIKNKRYCSDACVRVHRDKGQMLKPRQPRICPRCGVEFMPGSFTKRLCYDCYDGNIHEYHRLWKYGLTAADILAMAERQSCCCLICGDVKAIDQLVVDHDHSTGKVRGLLCQVCNKALGQVERDNGAWLPQALAYLEAHKDANQA